MLSKRQDRQTLCNKRVNNFLRNFHPSYKLHVRTDKNLADFGTQICPPNKPSPRHHLADKHAPDSLFHCGPDFLKKGIENVVNEGFLLKLSDLHSKTNTTVTETFYTKVSNKGVQNTTLKEYVCH